MKVTIKSFDVEMEVKNAGFEFEVYSPDGKEHLESPIGDQETPRL